MKRNKAKQDASIDLSADGVEVAAHNNQSISASTSGDSGHGADRHLSFNTVISIIAFPIIALSSTTILFVQYYNNNREIELRKRKSEKGADDLRNPIKPTDLALSIASTLSVVVLSGILLSGAAIAGLTIGQATVGVLTLAMAAKSIAGTARSIAVIFSCNQKIRKCADNTVELENLKKEITHHKKELRTNIISLIGIVALIAVVSASPPAAFVTGAAVTGVGMVALVAKLASVYHKRYELEKNRLEGKWNAARDSSPQSDPPSQQDVVAPKIQNSNFNVVNKNEKKNNLKSAVLERLGRINKSSHSKALDAKTSQSRGIAMPRRSNSITRYRGP